MLLLKILIVGATASISEVAIASVDFSNTVSTGVILLTLVTTTAAGFVMIRVNTAKGWRENYDAEHTARLACEEKVLALKKEALIKEEEQQALRHELKNEVAGLRMKTDLTSHEASAVNRHTELLTVISDQTNVLEAILGQLQSHT